MNAEQAVMDILASIEYELNHNILSLPVLPDIALKINQAAANEETSLHELSLLIQQDSALTAQMMHMANSALYCTNAPARTLIAALTRIGMSGTRNLVFCHCIKSFHHAHNGTTQALLNQLWRDSTRLAAVAAVLAQQCTNIDPQRALLAGLLQGIGSLALIERLGRNDELIKDRNIVNLTLFKYTTAASVTILSNWHFDDELIEVAQTREQWSRQHSHEFDLADTLLLSRVHSLVGTARFAKLPKLNHIPAYHKLPKAQLDSQLSLLILTQAKAQIDDIEYSLRH